jgi:hypothetical protein
MDGAPDQVLECNCSICTRKGYLHWNVPRASFRLLAGDDALATYRFWSGVAQHHFCRHCGVASFSVPRSHPDGLDVHAPCLDDVDVGGLSRQPFDGRNREAAMAGRRLPEGFAP